MLSLLNIKDTKPGFNILTSNITLPTLSVGIKDDTYVFYNPTSNNVPYVITTSDLTIHGQAQGATVTFKVYPGNTVGLRLSKLTSSPDTYGWVVVSGTAGALATLSNLTTGTIYNHLGSATSDAGGNLTVYPVLPNGTSVIGAYGYSLSDPSVIVNASVNNTTSARFQLRYNTNLAIVGSHTFGYVIICSKA